MHSVTPAKIGAMQYDLNGFEEIAEGIAYEILHDYVEAYPFDDNTLMILENEPGGTGTVISTMIRLSIKNTRCRTLEW